jgi:N4-gp56 family major capsid protein
MAIQTTSNLTNSIRTQYVADYLEAAYGQRLYDQLAIPVPGLSMDQAIQGSSVQFDYLSSMAPGTTAIDQTADLTPQQLVDATASVTPTSRAEALQWSENLDIQVYTNYAMERMKKLGENMMESIEILAIAAALQGAWVERAAARASLDAGTASHRCSDSEFRKLHGKMLSLKVPGFINSAGEANTWAAIMHPYVFHDISESGNVDAIGIYQDAGIHLNFELGKIGPFRLVVSPYAKVFMGAGADNASNCATTLDGAVARLATSFTTADDKSATSTDHLWVIGTEETANTFYPTNERVKVNTVTTTSVSAFVGEGENGGMRFAHDSGAAVRNADSVYTVAYGGPASLVKLFAPSVGEFGQVVGPKDSGLVDQFTSVGWKFYGGYGLLTDNRIVRGEYSTSYEA